MFLETKALNVHILTSDYQGEDGRPQTLIPSNDKLLIHTVQTLKKPQFCVLGVKRGMFSILNITL